MIPRDASRRPRVLVAEDDAALRRLLELRLKMGNYEVRTVEDGSDALAVSREWAPDILVCDVMMPRVSGLTVCKELRADLAFDDMPIILLTARVFDEDIEAVMRLGLISFMNKPFNLGELQSSIDSRLAGEPEAGIPGEDRLGWLRPAVRRAPATLPVRVRADN